MTRRTKEDLVELRKHVGFSQKMMSVQLGMSLRAYQAIEAGESECRPIHILAAERAAIQHALRKEDASLVPADLRNEAVDFAEIVQGANFKL